MKWDFSGHHQALKNKCRGGNQRVLLIQVRHSQRDTGVPAPPAAKGRAIPLELNTWNRSDNHIFETLVALQWQVTEGIHPQCPVPLVISLLVLAPSVQSFQQSPLKTPAHLNTQDGIQHGTKGPVLHVEQQIREAGGCGCTQSSQVLGEGLIRDTTS